jgi:stalled ribosome rescue protein Dom34
VRDVVRLDIKTPRTDVAEAVQPILRQLEYDAAHSLVEQLIEEYRRGLIAVAGVHDTERALERGQVDLLLVDGSADFEEGTRAELVRRAVETGAAVEVVQGSEALLRVGGVGALLRYPS